MLKSEGASMGLTWPIPVAWEWAPSDGIRRHRSWTESVPKWIQVHAITPRGNRMLDRQFTRMCSRHARHKRLGESQNMSTCQCAPSPSANIHQAGGPTCL